MIDIEIPDGLPGWITDHIKLYYEDPEKAHLWDATSAGGTGVLPTLLLISRGRKSGKPRPLPLIYREVDGNYIIIASKGGAPNHPVWYLNLVAEPECEIHVGSKKLKARMRVASGDERESLWAKMVDIYAPYTAYQQSAGDRQIPVVVLEPKAD
jgi:deazaflavin-dependent oxidoreductase (nitroreductase family)